jgi:hypothetical protein
MDSTRAGDSLFHDLSEVSLRAGVLCHLGGISGVTESDPSSGGYPIRVPIIVRSMDSPHEIIP